MSHPRLTRRDPAQRVLNGQVLPQSVMGANDGIVATAGIVEGLSASPATGHTIILAGVAALVAGGLSLGGAMYAEHAAERDSLRSTIESERRLLANLPDVELEELQGLYVARGLSADVAKQVAAQLTAHDALAAHIETEYGISAEDRSIRPVVIAVASGGAFAVGALIPLLAVLFAPTAWRVAVIFAATVLGLCFTSVLLSRAGKASVLRTFARALIIGVGTMLIGLAVGRLLS